MVKFECDLCGKCCASFGEFITVERQITDKDYFCRYGITDELFQVHVLPDYADEFASTFEEFQDVIKKKSPERMCFYTTKSRRPRVYLHDISDPTHDLQGISLLSHADQTRSDR